MSRGRLRTVAIVFVSMLIITGAGMLTSVFLDSMERKLLSQTGRTLVRQAGIGKSSVNYNDENVAGFTGKRKISISDRYEILCSWADAEKSILHEPMKGQLNEKQAISIGKNWIDNLVKNRYILIDNYAKSELAVEYAKLSTVYYSLNVDDEELLSVWNISYACGEDNRIILTIHALTGEIWRTLSTTYSTHGKWQKDEYEEIIRSSYTDLFDDKSEAESDSDMTAVLINSGQDDGEEEQSNRDVEYMETDENYDKMKNSGSISISSSDNWVITEYEGNYYNSFSAYLEKKRAEKGEDEEKEVDSYYMQTFCMERGGEYDIGFRVSKAEQAYKNGWYIGFEMLMLPADLSSTIVDGFYVYSSIYDK